MSNSRHGGKSVRFNEGSQQSNSSRHPRREDERDSGLAADRHYQSNNPDALREAHENLLAQNESLQVTISKQEASLSTSHRTIKQLESHTKGLATERDELKAENHDYKGEIAKLQSEKEDLLRANVVLQDEVVALREQLFRYPVVSDKMSGASGASGASGTSGSSSNNVTRRPSKRENQENERLKDRFNRSTPNDAPIASTSAIQPTPQRHRRLSKVSNTDRLYIEEPDPRQPHYNLVARPAPGHEKMRIPRSSQQSSGDYYPHPLPRDPSLRR